MKKQTILITGGGGYIGTNILALLVEKNIYSVVIDNFSNSDKKFIQSLKNKHPEKIQIIDGDMGDINLLRNIFEKNDISTVIHLAAKKYIPESLKLPDLYEKINVTYTKQLLEIMEEYNIKKIIFPSSITVYGNPEHSPTSESNPLNPLSKYAETKKIGEFLIHEWSNKTGGKYIILRLSNPIGANLDYNLGDSPISNYTNLTTQLFNALTLNSNLSLNGNNHPTKDGTTVRDYIHVCDVGSCFVNALESKSNGIYNIGYGGYGFSVLDFINELEKISKKKLSYSFGPKREGDVAIFISDNTKAKQELNLKLNHNLHSMIFSAYKFYNNTNNIN